MKHWKYAAVHLTDASWLEKLNNYGKDGWEVCGMMGENQNVSPFILLKKQIAPTRKK